jgi:MFS family permease
MREVILVSIALFGGMWAFQIFTSFLPEFFREYRGLGLEQASTLTGLLPLTGIFAAGLGGVANGVVGLRKPFLWPMATVSLIGYLAAVMLRDIAGISAGLVLVGIGASGGLAATGTLMMELPGMTPEKMGSAFATIWAAGYTGAFISPLLGGVLVSSLGLRNVLLLAAAFQSVAAGFDVYAPGDRTRAPRCRYSSISSRALNGVEARAERAKLMPGDRQ